MKKVITYPISFEQIRDLKIGDTVYYSGPMGTFRDSGHARVIKEGLLPQNIDLRNGAIYHAGPIVGKDENGNEYIVSIGPTTSRRMESCEAEMIEKTGIRLIIGKGGMMEKTAKACKEFGAIHCAFPGGCAVVAAQCVQKLIGCEWRDLGMPEACWELEVKEFGPLIVSIDTNGNNLFENNKKIFNERLKNLIK
ncbi:MAG: FumA C-terminus/TtdB family hydratase beta subunit [Clostridia bacterium]|nr:FumA C-terminus/TtdB family hydratase beta subunit [Clostridia bacterium]